MVKADVIYKIKQSNGTVTNYKKKKVETETYDEFLNKIEQDMRKLREKLGRKVRLDIQKFKRDNKPESKNLNAKEAISFIKEHSKGDVDRFLSNDEDRVTVLDAYKEKFDIEDKEKSNNS